MCSMEIVASTRTDLLIIIFFFVQTMSRESNLSIHIKSLVSPSYLIFSANFPSTVDYLSLPERPSSAIGVFYSNVDHGRPYH